MVPAGTDSFAAIGAPARSSSNLAGSRVIARPEEAAALVRDWFSQAAMIASSGRSRSTGAAEAGTGEDRGAASAARRLVSDPRYAEGDVDAAHAEWQEAATAWGAQPALDSGASMVTGGGSRAGDASAALVAARRADPLAPPVMATVRQPSVAAPLPPATAEAAMPPSGAGALHTTGTAARSAMSRLTAKRPPMTGGAR